MLKTEQPVKVSVTTLSKKIALQIPRLTTWGKNPEHWEVIGWFSPYEIGWRTGGGVAVLMHTGIDYILAIGHRKDGIVTWRECQVETHIYIK